MANKNRPMKFALTKSQRLVTNAAAKEKSRPVLTCVHIRKKIIEAANGVILVQKDIGYNGDEELLLGASEVARCRNGITGDVEFNTNDEDVIATGKEKLILAAQQGTFPNVDKLYPYPVNSQETMDRLVGRENKPVFRIALARQNLLDVLNCLGKEENTIKFTFYGEENPVTFEVTGSARGIIMPVKISSWDS